MQEDLTLLPFPFAGLNTSRAYSDQPPLTCVAAQNMLGFDPNSGRLRGSQRWGHKRLINAQLNSSNQIQNLTHIVTSNTSGASASTLSTRNVKLIGVAGGSVYYTPIPATSWTLATNGSGALDSNAPWIDSTVYLACDIYFADGVNYKYYDAATSTINAWTASAGTIPANGSDKPRLITAWRDRIILSGIKSDPTNWFMSALGDPTDWDYGATVTSTMAVAGNNSTISSCPDIINAIVPITNDVVWFLCDHSIHQMSGDPMYGGRIDLVTTKIGGAWGRAWCRDPSGSTIYFFGQQGGLWTIDINNSPREESIASVSEDLADVDVQGSLITLEWEPRYKHVLIHITPLDGSASTHYAYDTRNKAFWPMVYADTDLNPTAVHTLDGDDAADRAVVLGGQDGRVRVIDYDAKNDDDQSLTAIDSYVWLGPVQGEKAERFVLCELQSVIASSSANVTVDVFFGSDAEAAKSSTSSITRTLTAGRNISVRQRGYGNAMYVRLRNSSPSQTWAFESLRYRLRAMGRMMQRRFG